MTLCQHGEHIASRLLQPWRWSW